MWSKETRGWEEVEVDTDTNTAEGGTGEAEEGGGGITRALIVTTPALNKGGATVDEGDITEPAEAASALTSTVGATS